MGPGEAHRSSAFGAAVLGRAQPRRTCGTDVRGVRGKKRGNPLMLSLQPRFDEDHSCRGSGRIGSRRRMGITRVEAVAGWGSLV